MLDDITPRSDSLVAASQGKDPALVFLSRHQEAGTSTPANEQDLRRLRRKVDCLVMPFLLMVYTLNTIDKILLNYSAVMGIYEDLHLKGSQFSTAASSFWIVVAISAPFSCFPLQKMPIGKWIGVCLILWGVSTACHSAVQDFAHLIVVRITSGLFEASLVPAIILLTSQYYTRQEQASRYSIWYAGLGLGQIFGGFVSFAFQHVSPYAPLAPWRTMFLVVGLFTLFVGALVCMFVPDTPMRARFFSEHDKVLLLEHVKTNQTGIANRKWTTEQIFEALADPQYWLMCTAILFQGTGGGVISAYSATLLQDFGFSPQRAALLITPCGVANILSLIYVALGTRHFSNKRWLFALTCMAGGLAGAGLMTFSTAPPAMLAGLYLANLFTACTPLTFQWFTANTAGHTKRAFVAASTNAAFAIGNVVGPLTFRHRDAPGYRPAKVDLMAMWAGSMGCLALVTVYYVWTNRRRDSKGLAGEVDKKVAFAGLTDKQNAQFRYSI